MSGRFIYADNAATTQISESVLNEMLPYLKEDFGNPSSLYRLGRKSGKAVENARERIAALIGALPKEIFFTSCGTESDNTAIFGAAQLMEKSGKNHIITTSVEHSAVMNPCKALEKKGFEVTYLPVDGDGLITAEQVEKAVKKTTGLVSVMYANNEAGSVFPIEEIGGICALHGILFHTDAVQAAGNIPIDAKKQGIGMMSLSGHKIHGPKGTGLLYVNSNTALPPLIIGGGQERGMRSGTENTAGIAGLAKAMEDACLDIPRKAERISVMRDRIADGILALTPCARLNGSRQKRLCGNISLSFLGVESESLILMLDMKGICASGGSACASGSDKPSHVLTAMGLPEKLASGTLRLSFADPITEEDADYIIKTVSETVSGLRRMSPMWNEVSNDPSLLGFVTPKK